MSSPIGLGHAWRDVAIARELRALRPELDIDWLAQAPVTHVLEACGERIHPASAGLANESRHIAAESGDHELNVFQAWRRMDEILLANFMVFRDVARAEDYDLWIGDEAWELDYFLHENPPLKTAPYVFLTDFVGWLPMAEGGAEEARLTADYNAEMLGHIAALPGVRDRAIFVGSPEDVVPHGFGEGLPAIRPWVEEHFAFSGYVLGPDAGPPADRRRSAPSSATARTSGSASSRSAARASARGSSAASSPPTRPRASASPACAWSPSAARASTPTRSARPTGWRSSPTSTASRATSRRATSRSPRAA